MKVAHWTLKNGSGLHRVAEDLAEAERALGLESVTQNSYDMNDWEGGMGADIHVVHSHLPDKPRAAGGKIVWVGHGTPENVFTTSMEANMNGKRNSNSWMLVNYWLRNSDALVTFWPRHKRIWEDLAGKDRKVHCIPMGVNRDFWKPVEGMPKYEGSPSVLTAENHHSIKWPLDAVIAWPWVTEKVPDARLHLYNIPDDQNEFWTTLVYNNGTNFRAYLTKVCLPHVDLVRVFSQVDFYLNPVRYGDFNRIGLEAASSGCKVISYHGNPYADYWLTEGNQERQADELARILSGSVAPLAKQAVPSVTDMATAMKEIYESL